MNTLTNLVMKYQQETDSTKKEYLLADVYDSLKLTIASRVKRYTYSLRGDAAYAQSIALEVLMQTVEDFKYTGQEFVTYYIHVLENKLIDAVRKVTAAKRSHNTCYELSLEGYETCDTESGVVNIAKFDRFSDEALAITDEYDIEGTPSIATILDKYAEVNTTDADIIELIIKYSAEGYKKSDMTAAIVEYFGAEKYAGKVQRFVSHAKKRFKEFAEKEYGYEFSF